MAQHPPFKPLPDLVSGLAFKAATPEQRADWNARWWKRNSGFDEQIRDDRIDQAIHGSNHEWCE